VVAAILWRDNDQAHPSEAAVTADDLVPVREVPVARESQARLGLVGVVGPHERAGLAGRAGADVVPLADDHALDAGAGQVKGRACAVDPGPDDDHIRAGHASSPRWLATGSIRSPVPGGQPADHRKPSDVVPDRGRRRRGGPARAAGWRSGRTGSQRPSSSTLVGSSAVQTVGMLAGPPR